MVSGCRNPLTCISGSGSSVTQEFNLDSFKGIHLRVAGNVTLTQAAEQKVTVVASQTLLANLNTFIENDIWNIDFRRCINRYDDFEIFIESPELNTVIISGSGNIQSTNTLLTTDMFLWISGSGNITLALQADETTSEISGSGNISLTGSSTDHVVTISGSGNVEALNFENSTCQISIPGSGSCDVFVNDELNVQISGSGSVRYKGNAQVNSTISGSGSVTKID